MANEPVGGTPIPINKSVNPSWTASVEPTPQPVQPVAPAAAPSPIASDPGVQPVPEASSAPAPSNPAVSAPQPIPTEPTAPTPAPGVTTAPLTPPVTPYYPPPIPPVAPPIGMSLSSVPVAVPPHQPLTATNPELSIPAPKKAPTRAFPWKIVLVVVVILVLLGGGFFVLQRTGILFGLPRDSSVALAKGFAALTEAGSYHVTGTSSITFTPRTTAATTPTPAATPTPVPTVDDFNGDISSNKDQTVTLDINGDTAGGKNHTTLGMNLVGVNSFVPTGFPTTLGFDIIRTAPDHLVMNGPILSEMTNQPGNQFINFPVQVPNKPASFNQKDWTKVVKASKRVGEEQIGEIQTVHYQATVDSLIMSQVAPQVLQISDVSKFLASSVNQLDVWLGKKDNLPYQMIIDVSGSTINNTIKATTTLHLDQFGSQISIVEPTSTQISQDVSIGIDPTNLSLSLQQKLRDTVRKLDLGNLQTSLEFFKNKHSSYPSTDGKLSKTNDPATPLAVLMTDGTISTLPLDPLDPQFFYGYTSDGTTYQLQSILEDKTDSVAVPSGSFFLHVVHSPSSTVSITSDSTTSTSTPSGTAQTVPAATTTPTPTPSVSASASASAGTTGGASASATTQ